MIPCARLVKGRRWVILPPIVAGIGFWLFRHVILDRSDATVTAAWTFLSATVLWHLILASVPRQYKTTSRQERYLDGLFVTVNLPVYNEDPQTLRLVLCSLFAQQRLPDRIQVVVNGPKPPDYSGVVAEFRSLAFFYQQVECSWIRTPVPGKRHAQCITFADGGQADIFVTVDSDTVLDSAAIREGLKPFADPKVTSVAAVMITYNAGRNFLTRMTEVWFTSFQTYLRAAWSRLGCVLVNSGCLAFYRADVIRPALAAYASESFFGRPVEFSDDSFLTLFALLQGRTVQQPTSFAFMMMPERLWHHLRQQLRWYRGSFIRSWWRFRYLPLRSVAYWEHVIIWSMSAVAMTLFVGVFIEGPVVFHQVPQLGSTLLALILTYAAASGYLMIQRDDQSLRRQLVTFFFSPLTGIWTVLVLRPLRLYAMVTCRRTGWGTRGQIEVGLLEQA
jgi:hyaluronan synthase